MASWLKHLAASLSFAAIAASAGIDDAGRAFFESRIRPVFAEHCYSCHSADARSLKAGLQLDSREALLRGGDRGPAITPGDPAQSLLLQAVSYSDPDLQMPPRTRLPDAVIDDIRRWIEQGALWPQEPGSTASTERRRGGFDLEQRRSEHWAWQPVRRPELPTIKNTDWPRTDIDRLVLSRLEEIGLDPACDAEPNVLIRRASFVLTGLPPTPEEVKEFILNPSPDAFGRLVDRLLASPAFGERWARHWLDKVRYAETLGHEFDYTIPGAWRYRDYVIRAFNADVPYDRFVSEQIAGDLLPDRRFSPDGIDESTLATAHFWFGQQVHSPVDVRQHQVEVVDNQLDVLAKTFLGLTVSCARCHDHKFDAISTRDYYALAATLSSSRLAIRAIDDPAPRRARAAELQKLRDAHRHQIAAELEKELETLRVRGETPALAMVQLRDGDQPLPLEGWHPDGEAFAVEDCSTGQPVLAGDIPLHLVLPGWRHGAALSTRFQGALRSPTFTIDKNYLHLRLAGRGARFSVAVEGFALIRAPIYGALRQEVRKPDPHWVTVDVSMWKGRRAWLEFADLSEPDPASTLPPRSAAVDGWIAVGDVITSPHADPPPLIEVTPPADPRAVVRKWRDAPASLAPTEAAWLDTILRAWNPKPAEEIRQARASIEDSIQPPILAGVLTDGTGFDEPVLIRGNHRTPGTIEPRRFLEALPLGPPPTRFQCGSGRLALAEAITDPENPFFSRVMVNWIWHHLFGEGLVPSVDDFGMMGSPPSNPELLDWLAAEFRDSGWSIKHIIRLAMTSRTWQMSSRAENLAAERSDPQNRNLHRANLRRLEGEAIRDALLAISGTLDGSMGGPSVPIHLTPFMEGRGRPDRSGPADGNGRRSIYIEVRRNFLSPWMLAFDTPVPATTVGRRSVSNVPAQALALMNDPFVLSQTRKWAERVRSMDDSPEGKVRALYLAAFAREPSPEEATAVREFLSSAEGENTVEAWSDLCHALVNAKEFIFVE